MSEEDEDGRAPSKHSTDGFTNGVSNRKLTVANPVPTVQCTNIARSTGKRCRRFSLRGANVCVKHGGQLPNVQEHAAAVVEAARLRMVGLADEAVDIIHDLALNSTADNVRLKASTEILDRAGVRTNPEIEVTVTHNEGETAAERTQRALMEIAERTAAARAAAEEKMAQVARDTADVAEQLDRVLRQDEDVVDAEILEDEDS